MENQIDFKFPLSDTGFDFLAKTNRLFVPLFGEGNFPGAAD